METEMLAQMVISLITAFLTSVIGFLFYRLKRHQEIAEARESERLEELKAREKAINNALRALCHDRILQGYKSFKEQGQISDVEFETVTRLYDAYHALGGNGTLTIVYEQMKESLHVPHTTLINE